MLKVCDVNNLKQMGFVKNGYDYVYTYKNKDLNKMSTLFTVYSGSSYLRTSKTGYVIEEQIRLICKWSKENLIEWEEEEND